MPVERTDVQEIFGQSPQKVVSLSQPQEAQKPILEKTPRPKTEEEIEAEYSAVLAAFKVAARVIAIRLFLFLSLIGSFILALVADQTQTIQSAWVMVIFACVTTLPLTILEFRGRIGG